MPVGHVSVTEAIAFLNIPFGKNARGRMWDTVRKQLDVTLLQTVALREATGRARRMWCGLGPAAHVRAIAGAGGHLLYLQLIPSPNGAVLPVRLQHWCTHGRAQVRCQRCVRRFVPCG
jgi:hypothetical protein